MLVPCNLNDSVPLKINFALLDVREIPTPTGIEAAAHLESLLKFLSDKLEPKLNQSNVWLFILRTRMDLKTAIKFATINMKGFDCVQSSYVPAKAEMLDNCTNRNMADDVVGT